MVDAIPVTSVARTMIDIAGTHPLEITEEALDEALRRKIVSISNLHWRVREGSRARLRGSKALGALLAKRTGAPIPESVFERRLLRALKRAGLPRPSVQHEICAGGRLIARVDFAYSAQRLAIEADGYEWHSSRQRWRADLARRNALGAAGWHVLHVTWEELHRDEAHVARGIASALVARGFRG